MPAARGHAQCVDEGRDSRSASAMGVRVEPPRTRLDRREAPAQSSEMQPSLSLTYQ